MRVVIQLFAREPIPGQCKTRLIPRLGAAGAASLYWRMVFAALEAALGCGADGVQMWGASACKDGALAALCSRMSIPLHAQSGPDLGTRMLFAMQSAAASGFGSVLIGTDCPAQNTIRLAEAVAVLRTYGGWVFRPALDGGYVCVATRAPSAAAFSVMQWGTSSVMRETREQLVAAKLGWLELEPLADIDEPDDLSRVPAHWFEQR
ncbi:MAG: DUF2064 domain-containing protein [Gammaproteobacteria bacterium]|nr:DUF2064 domain-containing protein [Gammaproteobacteria bacterium]